MILALRLKYHLAIDNPSVDYLSSKPLIEKMM